MHSNLQQTPKERDIRKYLVFLLPFFSVLLILGGYFIGRASNKAIGKGSETSSDNITPTVSGKKPDTARLSAPISNHKKDLYLRFIMEELEDEYKLSITLSGIQSRLIVDIDGDRKETRVIWNESGDKDQLWRYISYPSNYISWSFTENRFAILLPDKILIYKYTTEPVVNDTYSPPRIQITLTKTNEFIVNEEFDRFDYPSVLFSGDGRELYHSSRSGIRKFLPEESIVETKPGYYPSKIYPVPNSSGIVYWINEGDSPDYYNHSFVIDYGDSYKKYKITSDFSLDITRQVTLSPDLDKACIGWESSGSKGSLLFNLKTGKEIKGGSGCINWINNDKVVLYSSDYPGGTQKGYILYYLLDLLTNKKTYLHDFYNGI